MTRLNLLAAASGLMIVALALTPALVHAAPVAAVVDSSRAAVKLQYAGALTFSPDARRRWSPDAARESVAVPFTIKRQRK
jgi:hypothetical protein